MAFSYSEDLFLVCFLGHICLFETRFFRIFNPVSLQTKDSEWKVSENPERQPLIPLQTEGTIRCHEKARDLAGGILTAAKDAQERKEKNLGTQTPGCIWEAGC